MPFQINKKYYIYIGIMIGFLIASIDTSVIAEENEKKIVSLEDKAIELAKQAVIEVVEEGEDLTAQKFIDYNLINSKEDFLPLGWKAIDVSESIYTVAFTYRYEKQNKLMVFHVIPKDNIAQHIDTEGDDGLDKLKKYMRNIKAISTYSYKKVGDNFAKLFTPISKKKKRSNK